MEAGGKDKKSKESIDAEASRRNEMALIGFCLVFPAQIHMLADLKPDHFADTARGLCFEIAFGQYQSTGTLAPSIFLQRIVERKAIKQEAALQFFGDCQELAPPTPSGAEELISALRKRKGRQSLRALSDEIRRVADEGEGSPDELLDSAESLISTTIKRETILKVNTLGEALDEDLRQMEASERGSITGLHTPWPALTDMLCGWQPGELVILAARPSMGKSAALGQILECLSVDRSGPEALEIWQNPGEKGTAFKRVPVGVFTLEMDKVSYARRMLCAMSGVNLQHRRLNSLSDAERINYKETARRVRESPLYIVDAPVMHISRLKVLARRMVQEKGVRCIGVDYLTLVDGIRPKGGNRQEEVTSISRGLKAIAQELAIPVIALAQINRNAEQRAGSRPRMSDLRESGSIEQDADTIIVLHRPGYYKRQEDYEAGQDEDLTAEFNVEKQRNGPTGTVVTQWDRATARFRDSTY